MKAEQRASKVTHKAQRRTPEMETAVLRPGYDLCNAAPVHDVSAKPPSAADGALPGKALPVFVFGKTKLRER